MSYGRYSFYTILTLVIFLSACTVKKRSYQKGYYVDWVFKAKQQKTENQRQDQVTASGKKESKKLLDTPSPSEAITASTKAPEKDEFFFETKPLLSNKDTCGDVMTLKIGEEWKVKVLEINEETIKYKRCDNFDGPLYTIGKEKVYAITYTNGYKEVIVPPVKKVEATKYQEKEYPSELLWATILPFVLGGIGLFIGIHFALKSKKKILANPNRYKGLRLAKFMLTFDILILVAVVGFIIMLTGGAVELGIGIALGALAGIVAAALYFGFSNN
jgi:hypothetical protein